MSPLTDLTHFTLAVTWALSRLSGHESTVPNRVITPSFTMLLISWGSVAGSACKAARTSLRISSSGRTVVIAIWLTTARTPLIVSAISLARSLANKLSTHPERVTMPSRVPISIRCAGTPLSLRNAVPTARVKAWWSRDHTTASTRTTRSPCTTSSASTQTRRLCHTTFNRPVAPRHMETSLLASHVSPAALASRRLVTRVRAPYLTAPSRQSSRGWVRHGRVIRRTWWPGQG